MVNDLYTTQYSAGTAADIARVIPSALRNWLTRNSLFPEKMMLDRSQMKYSFSELCALDVMSRSTELGLSGYLGARIANTMRKEFQGVIDDYHSGRPLLRTIAVIEIGRPDDDEPEFETNTTGETPWVADDQTLRLVMRRVDGNCRYSYGIAFAVDMIEVIDRIANELVARRPKATKLRPLVARKDAA